MCIVLYYIFAGCNHIENSGRWTCNPAKDGAGPSHEGCATFKVLSQPLRVKNQKVCTLCLGKLVLECDVEEDDTVNEEIKRVEGTDRRGAAAHTP
ncbi:unnamed protein product [Diplocarpon coronariae]